MSIECQGNFLTSAQGHVYKLFKNLPLLDRWTDFHKFVIKHRKLKPIIVCSNVGPGLTYFMTKSNFVTLAFLYENVDVSETIAACDLYQLS